MLRALLPNEAREGSLQKLLHKLDLLICFDNKFYIVFLARSVINFPIHEHAINIFHFSNYISLFSLAHTFAVNSEDIKSAARRG